MTTIGITTSGQMEPPGENASPDDIKAWVEEQLDLLGDTAILGRFVSLGPAERRRGGTLSYLTPSRNLLRHVIAAPNIPYETLQQASETF